MYHKCVLCWFWLQACQWVGIVYISLSLLCLTLCYTWALLSYLHLGNKAQGLLQRTTFIVCHTPSIYGSVETIQGTWNFEFHCFSFYFVSHLNTYSCCFHAICPFLIYHGLYCGKKDEMVWFLLNSLQIINTVFKLQDHVVIPSITIKIHSIVEFSYKWWVC